MTLPRLTLEPRLAPSPLVRGLQPPLALLLGLVLGAAVLAAAGVAPLEAYLRMADAAFGSTWAWSDTAVKATPILLTALAALVTFRVGLWNIGAEGQLLLGAWAATGVALHGLPAGTPAWVMLPALLAAGASAGALWAGLSGWLRARLGVSEIISTLLLTYVAAQWNAYWVFGPWSEGGFPLTPRFPDAAWLPRLSDAAAQVPALSGLTLHLGLGVALAAAAVVWLLLFRTRWGFDVRAAGDNPRAAACAGLPVARNVIVIFLVSGALAGLAGATEVSGVVHRLQDRFSPGYGFSGIIVAWLARLDPWLTVPVALLFGGLLVGGKEVQPAGIPAMLQGLILLAIAGTDVLVRTRIRLARRDR
jgi:simple sugar transport system permease protein